MRLRILVTGSRNWTDRETIRTALIKALGEYTTIGTPVLVHGNARGADRIAEDVWMELADHVPGGLQVERFEADWRQHGRAAGPTRNAAMVATRPTVCLAFPLGASPGTRGCMALAEQAGISVITPGMTAHETNGVRQMDEVTRLRSALETAHGNEETLTEQYANLGDALDVVRAERDTARAELERLRDALAEAAQEQARLDDQIGETRDGVMAAIAAAGLAEHVCDDDDLPDMVRQALTAAVERVRKLCDDVDRAAFVAALDNVDLNSSVRTSQVRRALDGATAD